MSTKMVNSNLVGQSFFSLWNLRVLYNTSIEKTVIKHGLKEVSELLGEANSS